MDTKRLIAFCQDWNAGMKVADLGQKYGYKVSGIRNLVATLRKKGVKLKKRSGKTLEVDVEKINRAL